MLESTAVQSSFLKQQPRHTRITEIAEKAPIGYNAAGQKPDWCQLNLVEDLGKRRQHDWSKIKEILL
jgi:hypothetical protein